MKTHNFLVSDCCKAELDDYCPNCDNNTFSNGGACMKCNTCLRRCTECEQVDHVYDDYMILVAQTKDHNFFAGVDLLSDRMMYLIMNDGDVPEGVSGYYDPLWICKARGYSEDVFKLVL